MMKYHEAAVAESFEWRSGPALLDPIGLTYELDPCAPLDGYYYVPALERFTIHDDGLRQDWGKKLVYVNPPWGEKRYAIVPWLRKFFMHEGGGIFVCVARTSCNWFQQYVWRYCELVCFPDGKTRFHKPDGSLGPEPTNGIALIGKGEIACTALLKSGLGFCAPVDRSAKLPACVVGLAPFAFRK
jgi:hypothetical protein